MRKHPHTRSKMTFNQHLMAARHSKDPARHADPFGTDVNRRRTVDHVPEIRKRRSERDPDVLLAQQLEYRRQIDY